MFGDINPYYSNHDHSTPNSRQPVHLGNGCNPGTGTWASFVQAYWDEALVSSVGACKSTWPALCFNYDPLPGVRRTFRSSLHAIEQVLCLRWSILILISLYWLRRSCSRTLLQRFTMIRLQSNAGLIKGSCQPMRRM
jgi:hypothetical protein